MSVTQWIFLVVAVAAVVLFYWRARRQREEDPWKNSSTEAAGRVLQPDYEKLGIQEGAAESAAATGDEIHKPARPVIIDPSVQDEFAVLSGHAPQVEASAESWENFSVKPDPQLGLNIEQHESPRAQRNVAAPPGQEKIIILHVAAKDGLMFAGPAIQNALQLCRLQFGMREIYHRITEVNGVPEAVFSVASMVKPGHLDPMQARELRTPGLTLFMVMPGPIDAVTAFRDMLDTAQRLATRLGGEVLDDKRSLLTHQSEQYLHDEIAELQRRWRAQPRRK